MGRKNRVLSGTKICLKCNCKKLLSEFYKDKRNKLDKTRHMCKVCTVEQTNSYSKNNRTTINKRDNDRYKNSPEFRLRIILRRRIYNAIKHSWKQGSAVKDLGCTIEYFKKYIEDRFSTGMTWENWGRKKGCWSIDHIFPLSRVDLTNRNQFLKVAHYTNQKPMWFSDNIRKGNKI